MRESETICPAPRSIFPAKALTKTLEIPAVIIG